ncbi:MAG: TatD family hydrolase [Legionella sp.]|nr:TatD family hydrolase [Legionella sp.]
MLIDSHCHLNFISLDEFNQDMAEVLARANAQDVEHFLCVCVELSDYPELERLAQSYPNISISVGVHPNSDMSPPVTSEILCDLAKNPQCIAIGETGLDYYRTTADDEQEIQRHRFRAHIQAAIKSSKPLIIHTRQSAEDTLKIMAEENASTIGGVMHCFSENLDIATRAMELNFYISFSGIVTFKNATVLQEVAKKIPLNRILIETDAPYLAPVPFRGKQNHPALVKYVAEAIAQLRGISYEEVARATTQNFKTCFLNKQSNA